MGGGGHACLLPHMPPPPAAHAHMFPPLACMPPAHMLPMPCTPTPSVHAPQQILRDAVNEWAVHILLECMLVTTRKRSLGQGNIFTPVCHSVYRGGVPGYPLPRAGTPPTPPPAGTPPGRYTSGRYTPPPGSSACWEIRATSGWYASYWNAFLFSDRNDRLTNDGGCSRRRC